MPLFQFLEPLLQVGGYRAPVGRPRSPHRRFTKGKQAKRFGATVRTRRHSTAIRIYFYGFAFERSSPPTDVRVIPLQTAQPKLMPIGWSPRLRGIVRVFLSRHSLAK